MGGETSQDKTPQLEQGGQNGGEQDKGRDSGGSLESSPTTHSTGSAEPPFDVPQRLMGDRVVDDMSFMIACTNWY